MAVKECCCSELSSNKKSIFGLRMRSQILYLLLVASLVHAAAADFAPTCVKAKTIFEKSKMLAAVNLQEQPNSGENGQCSQLSVIVVIMDDICCVYRLP